MAAPVTLSAILKTIQDDGMDADEALARKSALIRMIKHEKDFSGKAIQWSVPYAGYGGRSHDAAIAEAQDQNARYALFEIGTVSDYSYRTLNGVLVRKALKAGVNEEFIDYLKGEMETSCGSLGQNLARGAYASTTGRRGVRGSVSSAVLTLATISDAIYFSIGDRVVASQNEGGTLRDSGDFVTLIAVNTATGELTADANWSNIASMADGDSLYVQGDVNLSYHGLGSYCPATAPTGGDNVFGAGVDRSNNPEMLAGIRLSTTGSSVESVLIKAMAYCETRPGSQFDDRASILCSKVDFANVQIAKEGSRWIDNSGPYSMGVEKFKVGSATVVPDVFCPEGTFFILADGAFELHSLDGVHIDDTDGNEIRKGAGDTYKLSAVIDADFKSPQPGGIARGAWPAA